MQYGFNLFHGNIHERADLAHEAEVAGWDGVFYWDDLSQVNKEVLMETDNS